MFFEGLCGKVYAASYFVKNTWKFQKPLFWKKALHLLINNTMTKVNCYLTPNLFLNMKYEIVKGAILTSLLL